MKIWFACCEFPTIEPDPLSTFSTLLHEQKLCWQLFNFYVNKLIFRWSPTCIGVKFYQTSVYTLSGNFNLNTFLSYFCDMYKYKQHCFGHLNSWLTVSNIHSFWPIFPMWILKVALLKSRFSHKKITRGQSVLFS